MPEECYFKPALKRENIRTSTRNPFVLFHEELALIQRMREVRAENAPVDAADTNDTMQRTQTMRCSLQYDALVDRKWSFSVSRDT